MLLSVNDAFADLSEGVSLLQSAQYFLLSLLPACQTHLSTFKQIKFITLKVNH